MPNALLDHDVFEKDDEKNLKLILKALAFAAHRHRNQRRKDAGASPYINHPIDLALLLVNEADISDTDVICAALLHDTLEDTDTTVTDLLMAFGQSICAIVQEVTDDKTLPKAERKRLQIEQAAKTSYPARLVKLADKICNLRDINHDPPVDWSPERKREYYFWAEQVIDGIRGTHERLEQLFDATYAEGLATLAAPDNDKLSVSETG